MCIRDDIFAGVLVALLSVGAPATSHGQSRREKSVWNYDGGVLFATDGSLPNGVCFRVSGEINAPEFFDHLKRVDNEHGTMFLRGTEAVSQFPQELTVFFSIHDEPCSPNLRDFASHPYLTREMMSQLQLSMYWKHGVDMRPVKDMKEVQARVEKLTPYAKELSAELPERFEWFYQMAVSGGGVPLTDSLVFVFRTTDKHIAARVAARL